MRYFQGGGNYDIAPTYVDELLEDLTQLPLHKSFNMFAGSSVGSQHAAALSMPQSKGSQEARTDARGFRYFLMDVSRDVFPHKSAYYIRQAAVEIPKLMFEFFAKAAELSAHNLDKMINKNLGRLKKGTSQTLLAVRKLSLDPFRDEKEDDTSTLKGTYPVIIKPFGFVHDNVVEPFNGLVDKGLEYLLEKSRYDIQVLRRKLKRRFSDSETGEEPTLKDSLISLHVTSYNYTLDEPAYFFHYRDPVTLKSKHVSDPDLSVSDMLCRSSAAQTVFQPFRGDNGNIYFDIAHFDTAASAHSDLKGHIDSKTKPTIVVVGQGIRENNVRGADMRNMLLIRQLSGPMGAALIGIPQRHIRKKEMKDLAREVGQDNIIEINRSLSLEENGKKYKDIWQSGDIRTLVKLFGKQAIRQSAQNEADNIPDFPFFDSRDEKLRILNRFGFAMAWENAVQIVKLSRDLIQNAKTNKQITAQEAEIRLAAIESLFHENMTDIVEPANSNKPQTETEIKRQADIDAFRRKMYEKWPFLEDLKTYFHAMGTCIDDYDTTPFVPLRFGTALSDPDELADMFPPPSNDQTPPMALPNTVVTHSSDDSDDMGLTGPQDGNIHHGTSHQRQMLN